MFWPQSQPNFRLMKQRTSRASARGYSFQE